MQGTGVGGRSARFARVAQDSLIHCPTQILYPLHRINHAVGQALGALAVAQHRDELEDRLVLAWSLAELPLID